MKTITTILALVALTLPASASAQTPLTLPRAEGIARHALAAALVEENELAVAYQFPTTIVSSKLGECDLETAHRAICDYTDTESDGAAVPGTVEVWVSGKHFGVHWLDAEDDA